MKYGIYKFDYSDRINILISKVEYSTFEEADKECRDTSRRWQVCNLYVGGIDEQGNYVELYEKANH